MFNQPLKYLGNALNTAVFTVMVTALLSVFLLAGCSEEVKVGSNGTGMAAPIDDVGFEAAVRGLGPTQIGSAIVDDAGAAISINSQIFSAVNNLRVGMQANAIGMPSSAVGGSPKLAQVVAQSTVRGPVQNVDAVQNQITVLNRVFQIDINTVLSGVDSTSSVAVGNFVEIHAMQAAPQSPDLATRLQRFSTTFNAATDSVEVVGRIASLTASGFSLPGLSITGAVAVTAIPAPGVPQTAAPAPTPLSASGLVRVVGTLNAAGGVDATRVISALEPVRKVNAQVQLEGLVQELIGSPINRIKVANSIVDVSAFPNEALAQLRLNTKLEITATQLPPTSGTTLLATKLRIVPALERVEFVLEGPISGFISAANFTAQNEQINAMQATFSGGNMVDLANGKRVRIVAIAGAGRLDAKTVVILP